MVTSMAELKGRYEERCTNLIDRLASVDILPAFTSKEVTFWMKNGNGTRIVWFWFWTLPTYFSAWNLTRFQVSVRIRQPNCLIRLDLEKKKSNYRTIRKICCRMCTLIKKTSVERNIRTEKEEQEQELPMRKTMLKTGDVLFRESEKSCQSHEKLQGP